jgi:hypothetical protein
MQPWNIESYYGETHRYRLILADDIGVPLDVSKNMFQSKIKSVKGASEFNLLIDTSNAVNGVLLITLPIMPVGSYVFDIVMYIDQYNFNVLVNGTIRIMKGVTLCV